MMNDPLRISRIVRNLSSLETFLNYSNSYGGIFKYFYFAQPVIVVTEPEVETFLVVCNSLDCKACSLWFKKFR